MLKNTTNCSNTFKSKWIIRAPLYPAAIYDRLAHGASALLHILLVPIWACSRTMTENDEFLLIRLHYKIKHESPKLSILFHWILFKLFVCIEPYDLYYLQSKLWLISSNFTFRHNCILHSNSVIDNIDICYSILRMRKIVNLATFQKFSKLYTSLILFNSMSIQDN